ncbi:MAG: hypothetical protein QXH96_00755 [Candidatus Geothermarchaeota archaeon]
MKKINIGLTKKVPLKISLWEKLPSMAREMNSVEKWAKLPIHTSVYLIVLSKKSITLTELIRTIRNNNVDVSVDDIMKALLKLEIWGKIRVENMGTDLKITLIETD